MHASLKSSGILIACAMIICATQSAHAARRLQDMPGQVMNQAAQDVADAALTQEPPAEPAQAEDAPEERVYAANTVAAEPEKAPAKKAEPKPAPAKKAATKPAPTPEEEPADMNALLKALQKQEQRLAEGERKIIEQSTALEIQKQNFAQERIQFQKLLMQASALTGKPVSSLVQDSSPPPSPRPTQAQADADAPTEVGAEQRKQANEKPPEIATVIEEGGVLLQKGTMVVTPAVEYTHSSATRVSIEGFSIIPAVNIGLFDISRVSRSTLTPSVSVRYGITNRFEIEGKIPYVYRQDDTSTRPIGVANAPETLTTVDGSGLGDIEIGAHYQINNGEKGWPFFIANLRVKSATGTSPFEVPVVAGVQTELPTGSGFYAIQPSVTMIYPSDPVVYYSNFGYLYNMPERFPIYGKIEPGAGISGSFGMSMSINEKASFSVGYGHTTVLKTIQNGGTIPNSPVLQVGTLDFGYSYNLRPKTNLNFTVSAGITEDAPDVRLIFRVPMTFDFK